jgi:hypothetical protein
MKTASIDSSISAASISGATTMSFISTAFVTPDTLTPTQQQAADNLASTISPTMIKDLYKSLPEGSTTLAAVKSAMEELKTDLTSGNLTGALPALASIVSGGGTGEGSIAAGKQLAGLITNSMVNDMFQLVAPDVTKDDLKASIGTLKIDLKYGAGIGAWLKTVSNGLDGSGNTAAVILSHAS